MPKLNNTEVLDMEIDKGILLQICRSVLIMVFIFGVFIFYVTRIRTLVIIWFGQGIKICLFKDEKMFSIFIPYIYSWMNLQLTINFNYVNIQTNQYKKQQRKCQKHSLTVRHIKLIYFVSSREMYYLFYSICNCYFFVLECQHGSLWNFEQYSSQWKY